MRRLTQQRLDRIVERIGEQFQTFGGGRGSDFNPIAAALRDHPLQFAAGVDVRLVVCFVIAEARKF